MEYRVNSIFESVVGEGMNVGMFATFLRFSGCNSRCDFCDTQHEEHTVFSAEQVRNEVERLGNPLLVLTGGEPMLQVDEELLSVLNRPFIAVETNGSIEIPEGIRKQIHHLAVSPKCYVSGGVPLKVTEADELKLVWTENLVPDEIAGRGQWGAKLIQPDWNRWKEQLPAILAFLKANHSWDLSVQIHKFLGIN